MGCTVRPDSNPPRKQRWTARIRKRLVAHRRCVTVKLRDYRRIRVTVSDQMNSRTASSVRVRTVSYLSQ